MMLSAHGVCKVYRLGKVELPVLQGIDLCVPTGSFVSITGPSGAGKSTLLHLLAGLDTPTAGEVRWNDQPLSSMRERERARFRNRTVGFVFQFYHLLPELSAIENVILPGLVGRSAKTGTLWRRAGDGLRQVGLEARLHHRPSELSGGEQQRVAIARALLNEPQVLFCDEPTGNLDSATGEEIAQLVIDLHRQRKVTLVLVTHEAALAARADHAITLRDGRIVTPGPGTAVGSASRVRVPARKDHRRTSR